MSSSLLDRPGRMHRALLTAFGMHHHVGRQSAPFPSRTYGTQVRPAWMNVSRTWVSTRSCTAKRGGLLVGRSNPRERDAARLDQIFDAGVLDHCARW